MTARHARTVALAAILITLAPGVWVHARQELTPAAVAETHARAGHGDADAQYELGVMYAEGRGVPQNDAVAFAWYRQAAEQGVAAAQFNVGLMYSTGRGVPLDEAEAVTWYQQAAAQGLAEAQVNLGVIFAAGQVVVSDLVTAYSYFNNALSWTRTEPLTGERRDQVLAARNTVVEAMTNEQLIVSQLAPAYGSGDWAHLDLVHPPDVAGFVYSLELEGPDHLVGPFYTGKVDLRKEDGVWSGMIGFDLDLQAGTAEPLGNGEIKVTLKSARWRAPHQYVIRPTADGGVELSGRGVWGGARSARSFLSADATTLTTGHCSDVRSRRSLSSCLRFTGETGRSYEGQYDGRQNGNSRRYRLQAEGHLMPVATAREDPVLYVLLYALITGSECPQCGRTPFADAPARSVPGGGFGGVEPRDPPPQ